MRWLTLVLGLSIAFAATAQSGQMPADQKPADRKLEYSITATGEIEIAADGSVRDYRFDNKRELKPGLAQALDARIRDWRFEPIVVDGRAVIAKTRLRVMLEAQPAGDEYLLRIANVYFGEPERGSRLRPPQYPATAVRSGLGAKVILVLKLDDAGKVIEVHPEQTSLSLHARTEAIAENWRAAFVKASVRAARHWTFDISEIINGEPVGTSVRVPVEFFLPDVSQNQWQAYVPGPYTPAPWVDVDALANRREDLGSGDMQSLDSRFKLKDGVVGSVL